ncbi:carbohydrate ABC transporter permease [Streptomyces leeuwenhoekii]|uniref:L-arabinose transport system permease protein AraQ n=1 Tax=Streptomyces leeuwenhoekii TaxID=1437453 RepID=A0A0F7W8H2_STRLW|nr:carbohydrate ABC transporter permease [Streptomyces leeuwenhoekii]CQR65591.1 L-arabinose transport system permease protein AraQ [Streptomyces leeuwenhoekii]
MTAQLLESRSVAESTGGGAAGRSRHRPRKGLLTALLWFCTAYFLLPIVWLAISATKSNAGLFDSFGLWFDDEISLWENLQTLFTFDDGLFGRWMLNSAYYCVVAAAGAALLCTMAGYAFAKYRFPGDRILFSVALGAIMIPTSALALPQYLLFSNYQLTNSALAVILPALASPIGVFIMRVYAADAVPESLLEAARMDGAGEFRIFATIALRLLTPGTVTVFLFALVSSWNNYLLPLLMIRSRELYPVTVGLAHLSGQSNSGTGAEVQFSTVITGSLVSIVPLVLAFLYLQRYWQHGLTAGSVKA